MAETKVIYYMDDQETPYLIKLPLHADHVTLLDLKTALNRPNYKFFCKSVDDDFGPVKEEIVDDQALLPCNNGRIVVWLVVSEGSSLDASSQRIDSPNVMNSAPARSQPSQSVPNATKSTVTSSVQEKVKDAKVIKSASARNAEIVAASRQQNTKVYGPSQPPRGTNGIRPLQAAFTGGARFPRYQKWSQYSGSGVESSIMSSDVETTSFMDSEDDASTRLSSVTETDQSLVFRTKRRHIRSFPVMSKASSFSSITDSSMSLNVLTVQLNMDTASFLGISIVGQSNKVGDGGIYVGSIMKGGAVAEDGHIEPGDMILEVNGVSFENKSNDEAVRILREAVQRRGPITLVIAKCWDLNPKGYLAVPCQERARPIDPSAWILHTEAAQRGDRGIWGVGRQCERMDYGQSFSTLTSTSSSLVSSRPRNDYLHRMPYSSAVSSSSQSSHSYTEVTLTKKTDMAIIAHAMARRDSGLEVRDRMWLKIAVPQAFIGSELVDWLRMHVDGFKDRREARRYASSMLTAGYIQNAINKSKFSGQSYYRFGNPASGKGELAPLSLDDIDSVSSAGNHKCEPLGPVPSVPSWTHPNRPYIPPGGLMKPSSYTPTSMNFAPISSLNSASPPPLGGLAQLSPYGLNPDAVSHISIAGLNGAESIASGSTRHDQTCACLVTRTYKQIRRLWDNPEKCSDAQTAAAHMKAREKFDPDIDRSTSSDTESNDSVNSQPSKQPTIQETSPTVDTSGGLAATEQPGVTTSTRRSSRSTGPQPPTENVLPSVEDDTNCSLRSYRLAMSNAVANDVLQVMGEL